MSTDTWWTIRQALVEYRDKDFSSATNEQIHAMTDALAADLESQLAEQQQPAPVSATERDAVREEFRETYMVGLVKHSAFPTNNTVDEIIRLRARLAEAERVTEEQVERACVAVAAANQTPWSTGDVAFDQRIRRRMHTALTAARGGG